MCYILSTPWDSSSTWSSLNELYKTAFMNTLLFFCNRCRKDTTVQRILMTLRKSQLANISGHFLEEWRHYSCVGLPGHDPDYHEIKVEFPQSKQHHLQQQRHQILEKRNEKFSGAGNNRLTSTKGRNRIVSAAQKYMMSIANINLGML